jgi:hypothetical protein
MSGETAISLDVEGREIRKEPLALCGLATPTATCEGHSDSLTCNLARKRYHASQLRWLSFLLVGVRVFGWPSEPDCEPHSDE